jgi:hypothetical protein
MRRISNSIEVKEPWFWTQWFNMNIETRLSRNLFIEIRLLNRKYEFPNKR